MKIKTQWAYGYPGGYKTEAEASLVRETVEEVCGLLGLPRKWSSQNKHLEVQAILDHFGLEEVTPKCEWCGEPGMYPMAPGGRRCGTEIHICPPVELKAGDRATRHLPHKGPYLLEVAEVDGSLAMLAQDGTWFWLADCSRSYHRHNPGDPKEGRQCK